MKKRLAFLGPAGTYTEQAALNYDPEAELVPFPSFPAVAAAVVAGATDEGILAIENSLEGSVTYTEDLLISEDKLFIKRELVLPIRNCLVIDPKADINRVQVIYSHPQPLGQCRLYLEQNFPNAELVASLSTAAAVEDMQNSDSVGAAIANRRAAELYGAKIVKEGIDDNPNNVTRFVVLARHDHKPTGTDKTSLCFSFSDDAPGILYSTLGVFAERGINLAKIESRPTKESLGRYIFLVDIEGHREDAIIREALESLTSLASMVRIFGSYPREVSSSVH